MSEHPRIMSYTMFARRYRRNFDWVAHHARSAKNRIPGTTYQGRGVICVDEADQWMQVHMPEVAADIDRTTDLYITTWGDRIRTERNTTPDDIPGSRYEPREKPKPMGEDESLPIPTSVEELQTLAREGKLSINQLKLADDALKVIKRAREVELQGGRLLDAHEVADVWISQLTRFRVSLENLAARITARALSEVGVDARVSRQLRTLVDDEIRACLENLTTLEDEQDAVARAAIGADVAESTDSETADPEAADNPE